MSCTLVCSMKACSIRSLTSPCIDWFRTVTRLHLIISVQSSSAQTLQPLDNMANPLCDGKEQKTQRKLARATRAVTVNTVQPPRLEWGHSVSMVGLIVHIHPLVIPLQSSRWCPFFFCSSPEGPGPLAALLSFNETFLFVTPKLNLGVTGVTALVVELHGGPEVIGASLRTTDSSC